MPKPILYMLTKKVNTKSFKKDFFTFFPEEIIIIHFLKMKPMSVGMLTNKLNRIRKDEYNRKIGINNLGEEIHRSYDFVLSKVKHLIKIGFIQRKWKIIFILFILFILFVLFVWLI